MTDNVNGFSMKLPARYTRIADKAALRRIMKLDTSTDPKLKAVYDQYAPFVERARVLAFRLGTNDFAANFNVMAGPAGGMDAERIGDSYGEMKQALEEKLGAKIIGHTVVNIAGKKALRIEFRVTMAKAQIRATQVHLIHNGNLLILSIGQPDARASTAEANTIIDGLRVQ